MKMDINGSLMELTEIACLSELRLSPSEGKKAASFTIHTKGGGEIHYISGYAERGSKPGVFQTMYNDVRKAWNDLDAEVI